MQHVQDTMAQHTGQHGARRRGVQEEREVEEGEEHGPARSEENVPRAVAHVHAEIVVV